MSRRQTNTRTKKKEKKERATNTHNASTYDARFIVGYQRNDDCNDPDAAAFNYCQLIHYTTPCRDYTSD